MSERTLLLAVTLCAAVCLSWAQELNIDPNPCDSTGEEGGGAGQELWCWTCNPSGSEQECYDNGRFEYCNMHDPVCEMHFRNDTGGVHYWVHMKCREREACDARTKRYVNDEWCEDQGNHIQCINCGYGEGGVRHECRSECVCDMRGDPIIKTFDGESLPILTENSYLVAALAGPDLPCSIRVVVHTTEVLPDFPGVTEIEMVSIMYNDESHIQLTQSYIPTMDNEIVNIPFNEGHISIVNGTHGLELKFKCGIRIVWLPKHTSSRLTIDVDKELGVHFNAGLCGNCDGIPNDVTVPGLDPKAADEERFVKYAQLYVIV